MAGELTAKRRWALPKFENISFALVFLGLPLAIYVIFVILPFVQAFYYSLTDWTGFSKSMNFVGLSNYFALTQDPTFIAPYREQLRAPRAAGGDSAPLERIAGTGHR